MRDTIEKAKNGSDEDMEKVFNYFDKQIKKEIRKRNLYITGYTENDLLQEARIEIFKAMKNWDKMQSYKNYFLTAALRGIMIKVTKSNNNRNILLNEAFFLDNEIKNELEEDSYYAIVADKKARCPISEMESKEWKKEFKIYCFRELSDMEYELFFQYINGYNYDELKKKYGVPKKVINNAISRSKKKIREKYIRKNRA